jgi:hypothetical protein
MFAFCSCQRTFFVHIRFVPHPALFAGLLDARTPTL